MNFTKTIALETGYETREEIKTQITLLSSTNIWKGVMMKYKLLTIGVASLLPLGFAASASVANPTASHEVTFTLADARSISVAVLGDTEATGVVDLGVGATDKEKAIEVDDAVEVTFRATDAVSDTNKVDIRIQLHNQPTEGQTLGADTRTDPGTGIVFLALPTDPDELTVTTDTGGFDNFRAQSVSLNQNSNLLFNRLFKTGGISDTKFKVGFRIDTNQLGTQADTYNYVVLYTLQDTPS